MTPSRSILYGMLLFVLITFELKAQESTGAWILTGVEIPSYTGDLNRYAQFNSALALGLRLNHKENLNGQFGIMIGTIKGDDRNLNIPPSADAPNRFFSTSLLEVSYQLHYYLVKKEHWGFYISQGAGILRFNPQDSEGNNLSDLSNTRAEGETYRNISLSLPTKVGGYYLFQNQFGLNLEAGWHNPLTDYLDNISDLGESGLDNILFIRINLMVPVSL